MQQGVPLPVHTHQHWELWLTAWKLTPNFFFANLKANYCIFDSWLIGLLAMNLNMNKKGNRCIFWSNCDKTGTRQCMDRNCDRLYFMNINYCRVIQMLFNLLSKLMLINIHKTSKWIPVSAQSCSDMSFMFTFFPVERLTVLKSNISISYNTYLNSNWSGSVVEHLLLI